MRVHHLNCGTMCPRGARLLAGEGGLLASTRVVAHCLLIETGGELALVDTGFGTEDVLRPERMSRLFRTIVRPDHGDEVHLVCSHHAAECERARRHDPVTVS